jgi:hypothetical protein
MKNLSTTRIIFIIFLCITFVLGLNITLFFDYNKIENMENNQPTVNQDTSCPDLLVQKGNVLMLYNTTIPMDDNNPIPFYNLDEYIKYLEIQRSKGNNCPILFIKRENNTQGQDVYRSRPSPFELRGGSQIDEVPVPLEIMKHIDSSRDSSTYNKDTYPGFDPHGYEVGQYTTLDEVHSSTSLNKRISDNPMDPNWAGNTYTQQMIESGKYAENEITKPKLFNTNVSFIPSIPSAGPPPKDFL